MRLRFLACIFLVATTLLVVGQSNQQATPPGTEVLIPDGTFFRAELAKGLDANKVKIDDPVRLEVVEDVRSPMTGAVLIPQKAKFLARVSYVNVPKEKKERATLSIAIVGAEWKGGFAKLHGVIGAVTLPPETVTSYGSREGIKMTPVAGSPSGYSVPVGTSTSTSATHKVPQSWRAAVRDGKLVFLSSDRFLPSGTIFHLEHRVPQEPTKGFESYRDAALRGEAEAQFQLGFMYYRGEGVTQSHVQAADWFRRAAEQGHAKAQNNLGVMCAEGQGVTQDRVTSYMWFSLASAANPEASTAALKLLESRMTPEQIAEGKRRAEEWLKQHPAKR